MAIPGTVQVTGPVAPSLITDDYPTHDSTYGLGGYREVADINARNNIPLERQRIGMLVWVLDSDGFFTPETYILTATGTPATYSVAFPGTTTEWGDGGTFIYPINGAAKKVVVGKITAPADANAIMQVTNGNFQINGTWNGGHLVMGISPNDYHFWVDGLGQFRVNSGIPGGDFVGTIVGRQS